MPNAKISVTVDAVIFKKIETELFILLIQRKNPPFQHQWALPGGFVEQDEDLGAAARRELFEETQIIADELIQIGAFGKPHRDPRGHVISIAYCGFVAENTEAKASDDAKNAQWFTMNQLPELAFDHREIINLAQTKF